MNILFIYHQFLSNNIYFYPLQNNPKEKMISQDLRHNHNLLVDNNPNYHTHKKVSILFSKLNLVNIHSMFKVLVLVLGANLKDSSKADSKVLFYEIRQNMILFSKQVT